MNTTNLISTPNIEGNIGSCTTQSVLVTYYVGLLKRQGTTYTTNSCTGEVVVADYSAITGLSGFGMALAFLIGFALIKMVINN